ncbi:MAG: rhodanese-like domain-containing protein [Christensenellales bacterium]|jgi:phage shock protein E
MVKKTVVLLIAALLLLALGCAAKGDLESEDTMYQKITPAQAKERMESNADAIILDVRTRSEYEAGHIEGAVLLPNENIGKTQPEVLPDLDAEILVYCRSGNRSAQAAKKLVSLGYTNVYDFGGIMDWPYGTVKP